MMRIALGHDRQTSERAERQTYKIACIAVAPCDKNTCDCRVLLTYLHCCKGFQGQRSRPFH